MQYTYQELSDLCDEWYENLSEDAKYHFHKDPSPTFDMWVLSQIKPGDEVNIDYDQTNYQIIR